MICCKVQMISGGSAGEADKTKSWVLGIAFTLGCGRDTPMSEAISSTSALSPLSSQRIFSCLASKLLRLGGDCGDRGSTISELV